MSSENLRRFFRLCLIAVVAVGGIASASALSANSGTATRLLASTTSLFEPYVNFPVGDGNAVGLGDFNSDGLTDVAMSTNSGPLLIFLQKADGTLDAPASYAGLSRPKSLAVGDLNGDDREDVVIANPTPNTISVYLQQPDGTLAARVTYATSNTPDAVAVGDVNGDGLADVAVSHWNAGNIGIFTQNADGTLDPMVTYASPQAGYDDIAIGDVNSDGRNDVVKMNGQGLNPNLSVYLQNAEGTLASAASYSLACNCLSSGMTIGDVTGDGAADIVLTYGGNQPYAKVAVFAQGSDGTILAPVSYGAYDVPEPVRLSDLNGDGLLDVAVVNGGWYALSVYPQKTDGTLGAYTRFALPYASHYSPEGLALGDINQDGLPDAAIADYNNGLVVLYHAPPPPPTPTPGPGTVSNANDSGPGSLRQVIADATPGDTVTFDGSLAGQTIRLGSTINIDKDLTIDGSSLSPHVIISGDTGGDGTADVMVFQIPASVTATLRGVDISAGHAGPTSVYGGGITNDGVLTVSDCNLSNNSGGEGGAIANNGLMTITDSTFEGNTAADAGGVLNGPGANMTITGSRFLYNSAIAMEGIGGGAGGVGNMGKLSISNSQFYGNSGGFGGGGLVNAYPGFATVTSSTFSYNGTNGDGGAIYNLQGNLSVDHSTFERNTAGNMGGAINSGLGDQSSPENSSPVTISGSTFQNNTARVGGAVNLNKGSEASSITSSFFAANEAQDGVAVGNASQMVIENSTFTLNVATPSSTVPVGMILNIGSLQMTNNTVSYNVGGGLLNLGQAELRNNILANTSDSLDCLSEYDGIVTVNINNLMETSSACGVPAITADPLLGSAANNGGPTFTIALLSGSPAIDAGDDASCPATDQRGIDRPQGLHCDIGAFELRDIDTPTPTNTPVPTNTPTPTPIPWYTISGYTGAAGTTLSYEQDGAKTATSNSQGAYSFQVPAGWSGTVTPSKAGATFSPSSRTYTDVQSNVSGSNYTAVFTVLSTTDGGAGSLREAITDATSGETIRFDPSLAGQTIELVGPLTVNKDLTIDGSGLEPRVTISGGGTVRIFYLGYFGGNVTIRSLILKDAFVASTDSGAAVRVGGGRVTIDDVSFLNNSAYNGGAIYSGGYYNVTLTIRHSEFASNVARNQGGALYVEYPDFLLQSSQFTGNSAASTGGAILLTRDGSHTIEDNTFTNNSAGGGGALHILDGEDLLTVRRNLFNGNRATLNGGAIFDNLGYINLALRIENNTFYGNEAEYGGALNIGDTGATVQNNTFSNNKSTHVGPNGGASLFLYDSWAGATWHATLNNNILANNTGGEECVVWANNGPPTLPEHGNLIEDGSPACFPNIVADPALGPLADYGGQTMTMMLQPGSPAIDAGDDASCPAIDQRGITRPQGAHCDIGAFENVPAPLLSVGPTAKDYGMVKIKRTSAQVFTITDTGTADLHLGTLSLEGANPAAFHLSADGCTEATLTPGNSCAVTVSFAPTTTGAFSASLMIPSDAASSPDTVSLQGYGVRQKLVNGGLDAYTGTSLMPAYWTALNSAAADGKDTAVRKEGTASMKFNGQVGKTKTLRQKVPISGPAGSVLSFSFWVKSSSVPTAGTCRGQVILYNGTAVVATETLNCPTGTTAFVPRSVMFTAPAAYTSARVVFTYGKSGGKVWFDGVSLLK